MAFSAYGSPQATQFNRGQPQDDPNAPPKPPTDNQQQPTQGPPQQGGPSRMAQPQTFAQMQQNGQARPAPPAPQTPLQQQTQSAVSNQLANPSTYGSPEVQNSYNRLSQNIDDEYTLKARASDEQLAKRGLYDSTKAVGALSDLNVGKRTAKTELAGQLLDKQAQSASADRANAIAQAMGYENQQGAQGIAQQGLALQGRGMDQSYALGQGNLGVSQGQLALAQQGQGQQYGLAQQQLAQQGSQFGQNMDLQRQSLAQSGNQFGQSLGLQQQQLAQSGAQFDKSYGLQAQGQQQQYGLANRQLDQSGSQFDKSYGLQAQGQAQNYGLAQQQQALQSALGYGGMDLQKQQLAQSGTQFDRSLAQSGSQFTAQNKLGYDQLNSQAQLGNRGIDASTENAKIAAQMQAAALQAALGYAPSGTTGTTGTPGGQMPAPTGAAPGSQQQTPLDWYNSISGAPASNMAYNPNGVMAAPSLGFDPNEMDPRYYGGSNGV